MAEDAEKTARRLAEQHGLRFVDLTTSALAPGAASLLSEATARRHTAVPIGRRLGTPVIAVADPGDLFAMDALRSSVGREFVAVVARPDQVERAIHELYRPSEPLPEELVGTDDTGAGDSGVLETQSQAEGSVTQSGSAVALAEDPRAGGSATGNGYGSDVGVATDAGAFETAALPDMFGTSNGHGNGNGYGHGGNGGVDVMGAAGADLVEHLNPGSQTEPTSLEESLRDILAPPEPPQYPSAPSISSTPMAAEIPSTPSQGGYPDGEVPAFPSAPSISSIPSIESNPSVPSISSIPSAPSISSSDPMSATPEAASGESGVFDAFASADVAPMFDDAVSGESDAGANVAPEFPGEGGTFDPSMPPPTGSVPPVVGTDPVGDMDPAIAFGPPLARVLVESGRVTQEAMLAALQEHQQTGESLARYLYNRQMATEDDLVRAMAQEVGLEFVDLSTYRINPAASALIPEPVARHHMVVPIAIENGVPVVAMANPTDVFAMDDLRTIMGRNFTPVVATRSQISTQLRFLQNSDVDVADLAEDAASGMGGGASFELESLQSVVEDAPIVRYVNLLILQALNERASDIHIEPTPKRLRIRFRIDGVMHDATSASPSIHAAVTSRLKVLGDMDITEHRVPQEGRVSLSVSDRQIDLRLAMIPSMYGETCVMRLLDKSASVRSLPELGFDAEQLILYEKAYRHPYGVILVTGPTGAGKTTTLYATLQEVITTEKSVITVEDPVEYQIDAITQVQINKRAGLEFSTALRSILRADPDVVLIGEIRDVTTATIAMEAALSGHLVLSTLHTNTASATPLRLSEMGIEPFLITSALNTVLTQRLARVLCEHCKEAYDTTEQDFLAAGYKEADLEGLDISKLYRPIGCRSCSHTGYYGRAVLAEVMTISEDIERMIIEQESIVHMERKAVEQGMRTLRMDGLFKSVRGVTTLEEVLRVVV